jgi:hypothetical protein
MMGPVKTFEVVVQGTNWEDRERLELPVAPKEGETIETRYGTCVVIGVDLAEDGQGGRIICRLP